MTFDPAWLQTLTGRPELLDPQEMARADAASPGLGVSGPVLMANAGRAAARGVQTRFRPCRTAPPPSSPRPRQPARTW